MSRGLAILLLVMLGNAILLSAQMRDDEMASPILQPSRVEFEVGLSDREFYVVSAEDRGLLVVQETSIRGQDGYLWYLHLLDTGLNEVWKKQIIVKYGTTFLGHDFNRTDFILLFSAHEYNTDEMLAYKISLDGEEITTHEFSTVLPLTLSHFEVLGNGLIFGGESNGRPAIVFYDLRTKRPKVLPGIYNNKSSIIAIETSDKFGMFSVLVSEKTQTKDFSITIKVFSIQGEVIYSSTLKTELEKSLIDAVSTNFKNGIQYVAGTYANRNTDRSLGFYLAGVHKGHQLFIKYHPYADLENFFSYLKEKQAGRMKKRIERKKIKGKRIKLNYRLLVHDIIRRDDEYILIGEAYYPKYSSSSYSSGALYDPFMMSNQAANTSQRLLGYQYTHAVVVGFNDRGDIIWDNSFEINDVLLPSLEKNVQVNVSEDQIVLLYAYDNMIRSKVLSHGAMVEGRSFDPIELTYESDKVRQGNFGIEGLKEWYSDKYYAYGTHRIKNTADQNVKLNRQVFYINKVTFK